jgi:hypothetical protein
VLRNLPTVWLVHEAGEEGAMTEAQIKMLAKLRSLECKKSYWEGELLYWVSKSDNPAGFISRNKDIAQEKLHQLAKEFEEL